MGHDLVIIMYDASGRVVHARSDRLRDGVSWNSGGGGLPQISPLRHSIAFSDVAAFGYSIDVGIGVIKYHETHIKTVPRDIALRTRVKGHLHRLLRMLV